MAYFKAGRYFVFLTVTLASTKTGSKFNSMQAWSLQRLTRIWKTVLGTISSLRGLSSRHRIGFNAEVRDGYFG